ncbi:Dihydropyrimidinase [Lachnellula hyalina]|uniref:dihydropyrimidinase n=1 Tax=Lachnellula hyalina TaxID=1316788 RepID=A0A8H8R7L2_9HELO|nr:Dihydropyrimidinase [Lachnellula hyalina]TVY29829.1 Dihydropyrimidinase [Lachnellula hyalina]
MFDLVIENGIIVTASEVLPLGIEIGIKDGKISCLGTSLPRDADTQVIDAKGGFITPGGVDSHVHFAQNNSPTGDNFTTGSRSAIAGGTTTVLAFASQLKTETSVIPCLDNYLLRAKDQTYCDYGIHLILTNPTPEIMSTEMPLLIKRGITSVKLYMTYEPMKLGDSQLLDVLMSARALGFTTMIHAENSDIISLITDRLEAAGHTDPFFHAISRPQIAENEATYRIISLAELTDTPILIVHMSSEVAMKHVRKAQTRMLPIHAETCPQYLFLLSERLKGNPQDTFAGAKCVCSPPLRHDPKDLEAMWRGIANGTFTTFSSDHAPSTYDHAGGKKLGLKDGIMRYRDIPNGVPGVETRLPLLFSYAGREKDSRLSLQRFVQLTSSDPAKLYGLEGTKGNIAPGYDADLVIWYGEGDFKEGVTIEQKNLHHGVDYTPYEGMHVKNWPRFTLLRGKKVWDRDGGGIVGEVTDGQFLKRGMGKIVVGKQGGEVNGMLPGERDYWY